MFFGVDGLSEILVFLFRFWMVCSEWFRCGLVLVWIVMMFDLVFVKVFR